MSESVGHSTPDQDAAAECHKTEKPYDDYIEQMIRYDRWANLACVTALKHADLANQKAVGILGHIVGINEMWLT